MNISSNCRKFQIIVLAKILSTSKNCNNDEKKQTYKVSFKEILPFCSRIIVFCQICFGFTRGLFLWFQPWSNYNNNNSNSIVISVDNSIKRSINEIQLNALSYLDDLRLTPGSNAKNVYGGRKWTRLSPDDVTKNEVRLLHRTKNIL